MKSVITTGALALCIAGGSLLLATQAQAERISGQRPTVEQRVERMSEQLSLSDSQKASVSEILASHEQQLDSLHAQGGRPDRESMHALHESTRDALSQVLDEEQMAQLDEMAQQRRGGGPGGKRGGMAQ